MIIAILRKSFFCFCFFLGVNSFCIARFHVDSDLDDYKSIYDSLLYSLQNEGDFESAQKFLVEIKELNRKNKSNKSEMMELLAIAQIESKQSNYFDSNFHFYEGLKFANKVQDPYFLGEIYRELAVNHRQQNKPELAINLYKTALEYTQEANAPTLVARLMLNLSTAYFFTNNLDSTEYWLKRSFEIYDDLDSDLGRSYYYSNMADVHTAKGSLAEALNSLLTAKKLCSNGPEGVKAQISLGLAITYSKLKEYDKGLNYAKAALSSAIPYKNKKLILSIYQIQLELFDATSQLEKSNEVLRKIIAEEKALAEQDVELKLKSAKYGYDLNLQLEQNKLQNFEIEVQQNRNRNLLLWLSALLLFFITLIYFYIQSTRKSKLIKEQAEVLSKFNKSLELKIAARTQELANANTTLQLKNKEISTALLQGKKLERGRLASDLHDNLGGYITALRWSFSALSLKNLSDNEKHLFGKVGSMIQEAYDTVRNLSHNLLPKELSEMGLSEALNKLVSNLNNNPNIVFTFENSASGKLKEDVAFELYSVVLELLNNIIKHSTATRVEISLKHSAQNYLIHIIENGVAYNFNSEGFGYESVLSRLEKISGSIEYENHQSPNSQNLNYIKIETVTI